MNNTFAQSMMATLPMGFAPAPSGDVYVRISFSYFYKPNPELELTNYGSGYIDGDWEYTHKTLSDIEKDIYQKIQEAVGQDNFMKMKPSDISINILFNNMFTEYSKEYSKEYKKIVKEVIKDECKLEG